jgi:hypothetical protein
MNGPTGGIRSIRWKPIRETAIAVWRQYWGKTTSWGTIINAAVRRIYPSTVSLSYQAKFLNGGDYFGDFCAAARGRLVVVAGWTAFRRQRRCTAFIRNGSVGQGGATPWADARRYFTCINGAYYTEQLSGRISEIIDRYQPDAFATIRLPAPWHHLPM